MKRICVIGSSWIGAVRKAKDVGSYTAYDFQYYGSNGKNFEQIDIIDGRVVNFLVSSEDVPRAITEYDAFFIYGDYLAPYTVLHHDGKLQGDGFSQQVRTATSIDLIRASRSNYLAQKIRSLSPARIFVYSHHVYRDTQPVEDEGQYRAAVSLLENALTNAVYLRTPSEILTDQFVFKEQYCLGSVGLGPQGGKAKIVEHDRCHLNVEGGKIVLDDMMLALEASET